MKNALILLSASILSFMFSVTAADKIFYFERFENIVQSLFSGWGAGLIAPVVPLLEVVIVLLLCFATTRRLGFGLAAVALLVFTSVLIYQLAIGQSSCGCGQLLSWLGSTAHLFANLGLILVAVAGWLWTGKSRVIDSHSKLLHA